MCKCVSLVPFFSRVALSWVLFFVPMWSSGAISLQRRGHLTKTKRKEKKTQREKDGSKFTGDST